MKAHDLLKEAHEDLLAYQSMRDKKKTEREIADVFGFKMIDELRKHIALCKLIMFESYKSNPDALKTAINACYGLTSDKLKDPRNIDNIVVKYGASFTVNLEEELNKMGKSVVYISTDSIKTL